MPTPTARPRPQRARQMARSISRQTTKSSRLLLLRAPPTMSGRRCMASRLFRTSQPSPKVLVSLQCAQAFCPGESTLTESSGIHGRPAAVSAAAPATPSTASLLHLLLTTSARAAGPSPGPGRKPTAESDVLECNAVRQSPSGRLVQDVIAHQERGLPLDEAAVEPRRGEGPHGWA